MGFDIPPLIPMLQDVGNYVKLAALASQRMLAAMMVIPFVSQGSMPGMARHALVVALVPFVVPLVPFDIFKSNPGWLFFLSLALREIAIGIFMGLVIAVPFFILEGVGHALDFQSGLSNAAVYDPATHEETGPFGRLFSQVAVWMLFGPIGILAVVAIFMFSFELWPVAGHGPLTHLLNYKASVDSTNSMLKAIVILAAPAVVTLILLELCLGLVERFAQQLDVNVEAMPLKTLVAAATAALILSYVVEVAREERSWSDRALGVMKQSSGHAVK